MSKRIDTWFGFGIKESTPKTSAPTKISAGPAAPAPQVNLSELAYLQADEADRAIDEVEIELAKVRAVSLKTESLGGVLNIAKAHLKEARAKIAGRDHLLARAMAQTACNFAALAKDAIRDILAEHEKLDAAIRTARREQDEMAVALAAALRLGKAVRDRTAGYSWRTLRLLDLAAEKRSQEIGALLSEIVGNFAKGALDEPSDGMGRVVAWHRQAAGYVTVFLALDHFLSVDPCTLADKANAAYELAMAALDVFRDDFSTKAFDAIDRAGFAYGEAKSASDGKRHREVLENSLAALDRLEERLQTEATPRIVASRPDLKGRTPAFFASQEYLHLIATDDPNHLVARFPPALSAHQAKAERESWDSLDGPCTCR